LRPGLDHQQVDVHVSGPGGHEGDGIGHIVGDQRLGHTRIDLGRALGVAVEANQRELLGGDHARRDLRNPDRLVHQLQSKGLHHRPSGVLGRRVAGAAGIDAVTGDGTGQDDLPAVAGLQRGQQGLGHPQRTQHVGLVHLQPFRRIPVGHRVQPDRPAGVVDQQADPAGGASGLGGDPVDRLGIGDVELDRGDASARPGQLDQPVQPARCGPDLEPVGGQPPCRRRPDAARCPGHYCNPT